MDDQEEARRQATAEGARKHLANGTWPQVMAIFAYPTPRAPRTPEEEFARLKDIYEKANLPAMARFLELVQFDEAARGFSMSYNLSTRGRFAPGDAPDLTAENLLQFFLSRDILVGTRGGIEGAAVWFNNFAEALPKLVPESTLVMDKIFEEAVPLLEGPGRETSLAEMFEAVVTGEGAIFEGPDVPMN